MVLSAIPMCMQIRPFTSEITICARIIVSGFFFGSLVVRFGTRSVTMVCGVLATIGLMTTAFSSNIYMIYVGYGLIGGMTFTNDTIVVIISLTAVLFAFPSHLELELLIQLENLKTLTCVDLM